MVDNFYPDFRATLATRRIGLWISTISAIAFWRVCDENYFVSLSEIPSDVVQFVAAHIHSVIGLEILILLQARKGSSLSCDELAHELRINPTWTHEALAALETAGILSRADSGYSYSARTPELDQIVRTLARLYAERRVSIISLIFAKPLDPIQQFADAFRFKKGEKGDAS